LSDQNSTSGFATKLIHAGEAPDPITGAIAPVLVRTKTFRQPEFGVESAWQYSRGKNPTRTILEEKLASLVGGGKATVFGSGDAATTMLLLTFKPGDHIIACEELYGGTVRLLDQLFANFGIETTYLNVHDEQAVREAQRPGTKAVLVESPTNPKLGIIDLGKVGELAHSLGLKFITDLTFAPPCTTDPYEYGADVIIYSLSKYFAGHNDVIGGAIVTRDEELDARLRWLQWSVGACLSPDECYRVIQEIKTLNLRWQRVSSSALEIAKHLQGKPEIAKIYYAGLKTHEDHEIAARQMKNGFGAALSFRLRANDKELLKQFVDKVQSSGVIVFAESLASPETILAHPATMSHRSLTPERRKQLGISDGFFRLSVGFEEPADIIGALEEGFEILSNHSVDKDYSGSLTSSKAAGLNP
jgi:cystathionine beta-lyase/cystathionine gamma-synthase